MNFFLWMGVIFRDESNEPSSIIIGYRDATETSSNHPQIVRSKVSLAIALLHYHNCGDYFIIRFHLIPLIRGQKAKKIHKNFFIP